MTCNPHWTTYLSALLVPIIAVLGIAIAYRQWRTAQNKLKLDLFEKRFGVYDAACRFLASIMTRGKVLDGVTHQFIVGTREAKWLLNSDIAEYLNKQLYHKALQLQGLDAVLEGLPVGPERVANVKEQGELKDWMLQQYKVLDEMFFPFLRLEHY